MGVLSPAQRATVIAIAEAVFTSDAGPPPGARLDWLADEAEDFLQSSGRRTTRSIQLLIVLVAWLAPWMALRPTAIRSMPLEQRIRVLDRMEKGFASALIVALKASLCVVYYEHSDVAAEIGFDGECFVASTQNAAATR